MYAISRATISALSEACEKSSFSVLGKQLIRLLSSVIRYMYSTYKTVGYADVQTSSTLHMDSIKTFFSSLG